jgi:hypothetical protein
MIKTKVKVSAITAMEKIKVRRIKNNAKILAMIEVPKIEIAIPAIINKIKGVIFFPHK